MTEEITFIGRLTYNCGKFYDLDCGNQVMQILLEPTQQKQYAKSLSRGNIVRVKGAIGTSIAGTLFIAPTNLELLAKTRIPIRTKPGENRNPFVESTYNREQRSRLALANEVVSCLRK